MLSFITWTVDPDAFSIFGREIRWYGICWAVGILCTTFVVQQMYKREKLPEKWFDSLFIYVVVGLIIGARLGHCLFYAPIEYLLHPVDLLKIWEGGLASHGGAIGMTIAVSLYSIKLTNKNLDWKNLALWAIIGLAGGVIANLILGNSYKMSQFGSADEAVATLFMGFFIGVCISLVYTTRQMSIKVLDRLIVGVAVGAAFIRLGNLMNSEIYGGPTTLPWGFNFVRDSEWIGVPCHPTQIYEALTYLCIFALTMFMYWKTGARFRTGLILGVALVGIFLSRFLFEFIKNPQVGFEQSMLLNMGQILSIPFIFWGGYMIWNALSKAPIEENIIIADNKKGNKKNK